MFHPFQFALTAPFKSYKFFQFRHKNVCQLTQLKSSGNEEVNKFRNFITNIVDEDLKENTTGGILLTRFPPEPNGYLHLGHAKSICLNFGLSKYYNGKTNLRFDDTNPEKENMEYITSIINDVKWLVGDDFNMTTPWNGDIKYASDYFEKFYQSAIYLIKMDLAYVDDLTQGQL
jgi:glutaminyl-tRNA synthetase